MHTGEIREGAPGPRYGRGGTHVTNVVKKGISFGSALAIAISWSEHHSILWAILHGIFSWFYVVWYALTR